jgi:ParB family transcriptional regulator, chromosome partitioning protein
LEEIDMEVQRTFDNVIFTLKIALSKIREIIGDVEDNWIVYEVLMQHKNMLNDQINVLIKEKKKLY